MKSRTGLTSIGLLAFAAVLAGCGETPAPPPPAPPAAGMGTTAVAPPYEYKTQTGTPVSIGDPSMLRSQIQARNFGSRYDPFALLPIERIFDQSQTAERLVGTLGYSTYYEPPADTGPREEVVEPQPYRRLAGILVGDTVSAIIIMEDGTAHLIKPGMFVPNTPWRVVSIDEEKAVLRRAGNVKPTQITIRLESPPGGFPGGGGAPGGGAPGGFGAPGGGAVPGGGGGAVPGGGGRDDR